MANILKFQFCLMDIKLYNNTKKLQNLPLLTPLPTVS